MHRLSHHGRKVGLVKLIWRFATIGAAAMAAALLGAGSAQAQAQAQDNDGTPLSLLGLPLIKIGNGDKGGNGAGGVAGARQFAGPTTQIAPVMFGSQSASCPDGQIATGGGYDSIQVGGEAGGFRATHSRPLTVSGTEDRPVAWSAGGINEGQAPVSLMVYVVCVDAAE